MFLDDYYLLIMCLCSSVMPLPVRSDNGGHAPQIRQHPNPEVAYKELEAVDLTCEAQGFPKPQFYWEKDGVRLELSDSVKLKSAGFGTLTILNPLPLLHDGIYQCFAYNEFGVAVTTKAIVRKAELKSFPSVTVPKIHYPQVGSPLTLTCNPPQSYPSGVVYWGENNSGARLKDIENTDRMSLDYKGNLYFSHILPDDDHDNRTYVCIVQENDVLRGLVTGADQRINPVEGPLTYRAPELMWSSSSVETAVKGKTKKMKCIFSGYPTPVVTWTRVDRSFTDRVENSSFGQEIIIKQVSNDDAGQYRCSAKNSDSGQPIRKDIKLIVESAPYWRQDRPPQDATASEDENVEFECTADGIPPPTVSWSFNARPYSELTPDSRIIVSGSRVQFLSVLKNDSQVLQCNASNIHGYILANAFLRVRAEPPSVQQAPENVKVAEGRTMIVSCRMDGAPKPIIEWTRGDSKTPVNGGRFRLLASGDLEIRDASVEDTDAYHCTGTNKLGKETVSGHVTVRNKTLITEPPHSQMVNLSSRVRFVCKATTDQNEMSGLTITWYKDGQLLDRSSSHTIASFIFINDSLIIGMAQVSDTGKYTCRADNKVDSDEVTVELIVRDRPQPPTNVHMNKCTTSRAEVSWTASIDNNDRVVEYVVFYNTSHDPTGSYHVGSQTNTTTGTVHSLQPWTNYTFHVTARNSMGTSDPSHFTRVLCSTPQSRPSKSPAHVCTRNGKPGELVILWKPMPRSEHHGENFHYKVTYSPAPEQTDDGDIEEEKTVNVSDWRLGEIVIPNQGTYRRFKISVLAANNVGTAPDKSATAIFGHSSEGVPSVIPKNFRIEEETLNSTSVLFMWDPIDTSSAGSVNGFFKGFQVRFWKRGNPGVNETEDLILHNPPPDCELLKKSPKRNQWRRSVEPFKLLTHKLWGGATIAAAAVVLNGASAGQLSDTIEFTTPEGVPEIVSSFSVLERGTHHLKLEWQPPTEINGVLEHFRITYRALNGSNQNPFMEVIYNLQQTTTKIHDLEPGTAYSISIEAHTAIGGGPTKYISESTLQLSGPLDVPCIDQVTLGGEDFVVVTWQPSCEKPAKNPGSKFLVEYNTTDMTEQNKSYVEKHYNWVNLTGLTPGKTYEVVVVAMNPAGEKKRSESRRFDFGPQQEPILHTSGMSSWLIALIVAILLFLLILLLICFIKHRKRGKYPVYEKEKLHGCNPDNNDEEPKFGEYTKSSAPALRPISHGSVDSMEKPLESDTNSLAEYEDTDPTKFNEDGSFIGQYGGQKKVATTADHNAPFATIV